jgi:hypothetical protein
MVLMNSDYAPLVIQMKSNSLLDKKIEMSSLRV